MYKIDDITEIICIEIKRSIYLRKQDDNISGKHRRRGLVKMKKL